MLQSTPRSRGATRRDGIHIHLPECFNPRPAHAERRGAGSILALFFALQSTPRSRGATGYQAADRPDCGASIHAPLTRSDTFRSSWRRPGRSFNPRPAHAERLKAPGFDPGREGFNPRPAHAERRLRHIGQLKLCGASIHAPLTRSDTFEWLQCRTIVASIHAPLTRSDQRFSETVLFPRGFNPRPAHAERQISFPVVQIFTCFNPRPAHAERLRQEIPGPLRQGFNPRPAHAERQSQKERCNVGTMASIHAPLTRSDGKFNQFTPAIFQHLYYFSLLNLPYYYFASQTCVTNRIFCALFQVRILRPFHVHSIFAPAPYYNPVFSTTAHRK